MDAVIRIVSIWNAWAPYFHWFLVSRILVTHRKSHEHPNQIWRPSRTHWDITSMFLQPCRTAISLYYDYLKSALFEAFHNNFLSYRSCLWKNREINATALFIGCQNIINNLETHFIHFNICFTFSSENPVRP